MRYLAFGSNLHVAHFRRWAQDNGHPHARLGPTGRRAWIPDHALAFHYRSQARGGGALDVRPQIGAAVPGVIFECDEATWSALDHKEGRPGRYDRAAVIALDEAGHEHAVTTYRVTPARREPHHIPPHPAYLDLVLEGCAQHGLPSEPARLAARGLGGPVSPRAIFVYGTLRSGEQRWPILAPFAEQPPRTARVRGTLFDLGEYPGLRAEPGGGSVVGEVVTLTDPSTLHVLDEVEEFWGYGQQGSLYRRIIARAELSGGPPEWVWTYLYTGSDGEAIESGDWYDRSGIRAR